MYDAKDAGRDRVSVFDEVRRSAISARISVENDLRHALERGELAVWYQPEVDLTTGAVVAVEALLRWHHPDGTVWTADRFIDVAEDTGLILDIGDWVLRQACAQGADWAAARPDRPVIVRVNVSTLQLAEAGLLPALDEALATSGLDPSLLCVEITETSMLRKTSTSSGDLHGIRERGVGIAIDDFGTGYASLTYLREYPIDVIKIDRASSPASPPTTTTTPSPPASSRWPRRSASPSRPKASSTPTRPPTSAGRAAPAPRAGSTPRPCPPTRRPPCWTTPTPTADRRDADPSSTVAACLA